MRFTVARATLAGLLLLGGCEMVPPRAAAKFPVRDEASAIRLAKHVCRRNADPAAQWQANWIAARKGWIVDTEPSMHKSGDDFWFVEIPTDAQRPSICQQCVESRRRAGQQNAASVSADGVPVT
jgi:hypothetical protein